MKRKILVGLILLSIIASLFIVIGRYRVEQTSKRVEIVLDYPAFEQLQRKTKIPAKDLLGILRTAGVTSVAIYEKNLAYYQKKNDLVLISGHELAREYYFNGQLDSAFDDLFQSKTDQDNYFLLFSDYEKFIQFEVVFDGISEIITRGTFQDDQRGIYVLELENGDTQLENYLLGFSTEEVELIAAAGLKVVPRIGNTKTRLAILPEILADVQKRATISQIIFSGGTVIGYPDRLADLAELLNKEDLIVGMIEPFIGKQLGIKELAVFMDLEITRVHSFQQKEMEKYSLSKTTDRYLRAVKERSIRTLYYRPILNAKDDLKPLELNQRLLADLQLKLEKSGYTLGVAQPFLNRSTSPIWIVVICSGVLAAGLLLLRQFISLPSWLEFGLLGLGIFMIFLLSFKGYVLLTRDVLALLAAIILPSLAIINGYNQATSFQPTSLQQQSIRYGILLFLRVLGMTMIGVLLIIALLSDVRYLYQINQFRGIKFSFLLPLLIVAAYYIKDVLWGKTPTTFKQILKKVFSYLQKPIRYSHLVLLILVGLVGVFYLGRTGNFPIFPVTSLEVQIRDLLEDFLIFRPRFKEFAIGHPFLILAFYYLLKKEKHGLALPFLIVGSIGPITVLNTFTHIHTPLMVSLLRVISASILGILGGLVLIWLYRLIARYWFKLRSWIYE